MIRGELYLVTVEKILESIEDVEYIRKLQDLYFVETKDGCKTCRGYVVHPNGDISDFSFAMIGFDKLETYLNAEVVYDSSINAIKHHGVKGMKWGIHKQYGSYPRKDRKSVV